MAPTQIKAKKHADAVKAGMTLPPRKVVQNAPTDSAIAKGLQKSGENDRATVTKLHEITFYMASQGLPFAAFEKQVELETLHGVKYTGSYGNDTACRNWRLFV